MSKGKDESLRYGIPGFGLQSFSYNGPSVRLRGRHEKRGLPLPHLPPLERPSRVLRKEGVEELGGSMIGPTNPLQCPLLRVQKDLD